MNDYIKREDVMKELDKEVEDADDWKTAHEIANVVKYFPSADVVKVVRCKTCKYAMTQDCPMDEVYADDYCSYGE